MRRIVILGGAGFIGKNLALRLSKSKDNIVTVVDVNKSFFDDIVRINNEVCFCESQLDQYTDFDTLLRDADIVYHLISTSMPSNTNSNIPQEISANVVMSAYIFEACVKNNVKRVVFTSSGGTVYGKDAVCPIKEDEIMNPISSYGIQKMSIEKLLYLYNYLYGLDYKIVRISNPYGPYQRPNGLLGVVTTFIYNSLINRPLKVYGDGTVVRDYIYIDDCINGIINVMQDHSRYSVFNLGSGVGISVNDVISIIKDTLKAKADVQYMKGRKADVPINFLDVSRYEEVYGKLNHTSFEDGIRKTAEYMKHYIESE